MLQHFYQLGVTMKNISSSLNIAKKKRFYAT